MMVRSDFDACRFVENRTGKRRQGCRWGIGGQFYFPGDDGGDGGTAARFRMYNAPGSVVALRDCASSATRVEAEVIRNRGWGLFANGNDGKPGSAGTSVLAVIRRPSQ